MLMVNLPRKHNEFVQSGRILSAWYLEELCVFLTTLVNFCMVSSSGDKLVKNALLEGRAVRVAANLVFEPNVPKQVLQL